jgi:hypothetical protein
MTLGLNYLNWKKNIIVVLIFCVFISGCEKKPDIEQTNKPKAEINASTSPTPTPVITEEPSDIKVVTEKESHEHAYREHTKAISVLKELVKMDKVFLGKALSDNEVEIRRKKVFKLVDSLNGEVMSLITLAMMSQIFRQPGIGGHNYYFAPSIYDTAFLYCVKTIAVSNKNNEGIMSLLRGLKQDIIDGHTYADYILAFDGKDPMFLYDKEPDPAEIDRIKREYKIP